MKRRSHREHEQCEERARGINKLSYRPPAPHARCTDCVARPIWACAVSIPVLSRYIVGIQVYSYSTEYRESRKREDNTEQNAHYFILLLSNTAPRRVITPPLRPHPCSNRTPPSPTPHPPSLDSQSVSNQLR